MENLILMILLAAFAGGSVAPFAKVALEAFPPFTLILIRFFSASFVLLPFVLKKKEFNLKLFRELLPVAVIGSLNPILLFIALQFTPSSVSPLIYAAVPLMTALYMHWFKAKRITSDKILGIVVGFIGVAIIILLPFFQKGNTDFKSFGGNILILGAAAAFMFYGILSSEKQQQCGISPLALTFYMAIVTLVLSVPFSVYEILRQPIDYSAIQVKHILSALEVGMIGSSLFYLSYQKAVQLGNELTASLFAYLQPIATIIFAVILLGEEITFPFIVGGILAVIGAQMALMKSSPKAVQPTTPL